MSFKRNFMEEHDKIMTSIVKRVKEGNTYKFKKKSNRIQHELNDKVLDKVVSAQDQLLTPTPGLQKTITMLNEGEVLIKESNKMIDFADSSDPGWAAVDEYLQKPIASDSDDDRRLRWQRQLLLRRLSPKEEQRVEVQVAFLPVEGIVSSIEKAVVITMGGFVAPGKTDQAIKLKRQSHQMMSVTIADPKDIRPFSVSTQDHLHSLPVLHLPSSKDDLSIDSCVDMLD